MLIKRVGATIEESGNSAHGTRIGIDSGIGFALQSQYAEMLLVKRVKARLFGWLHI
jgi:hypothetical protein